MNTATKIDAAESTHLDIVVQNFADGMQSFHMQEHPRRVVNGNELWDWLLLELVDVDHIEEVDSGRRSCGHTQQGSVIELNIRECLGERQRVVRRNG